MSSPEHTPSSPLRVNTAVCGIYHYRKYIGDYSRSGQLRNFFYSHKRSSNAKALGIVAGRTHNLWMKEYAMAAATRFPARWRVPDRIGPPAHRLWERQVLARWEPCDLLHMHLLGTGAPIMERARAEGAVTLGEPVMCHPLVLSELLHDEHDRLGLPPPSGIDNQYLLLREQIPYCDRIVAGSRVIRDSYVKKGFPADRVAVIPYCVDVARFHPLSPEERRSTVDGKFRVICVAQITPRKGIHYLLEAWERMRLPPQSSELVLIGPIAGTMEGVLRKHRGSFTHHPHVAHEQLRLQYGRSSVFVLPSVEDGFGYVTAEAMGCGLPVVVSDGAGSADIVSHGENGFVVPARSVDAIQDALESLYRDRDLRESMAKCSLAHSHDRYRWADYAARLAEHHRTIAAAGR